MVWRALFLALALYSHMGCVLGDADASGCRVSVVQPTGKARQYSCHSGVHRVVWAQSPLGIRLKEGTGGAPTVQSVTEKVPVVQGDVVVELNGVSTLAWSLEEFFIELKVGRIQI